jgi:hypothetical protein
VVKPLVKEALLAPFAWGVGRVRGVVRLWVERAETRRKHSKIGEVSAASADWWCMVKIILNICM